MEESKSVKEPEIGQLKNIQNASEFRVDIYDDDSIKGMPSLGGVTKIVVYLIGILVSCLSIYEAVFGNFEPALQRPLHVFLICTLTFILYPSRLFKPAGKIEGIMNIVLILMIFMTTFWAYISWTPLYIDPYPTPLGVAIGLLCIALVLEATRRAVGLPMAIIGIVMLSYCFIGRCALLLLIYELCNDTYNHRVGGLPITSLFCEPVTRTFL